MHSTIENMFRVVTIAREYGSGGAAIAQRVAQNLGWRLLDNDLIEAVARWANVDVRTARRYDECVDSWWHRINRAGLWSAAIMAGATPAEVQFFDAETIAAITHEVIQRAASKGNCVIVGRGAQCVLRNWPEVLHVFVYGPWAERVARVQEQMTNDSDAAQLIRLIDRTRAASVRRYFRCDWRDPRLYHMMISSQLGIENLASMITRAVRYGELAAVSSGFATARSTNPAGRRSDAVISPGIAALTL
jgi:cytidylate kinase